MKRIGSLIANVTVSFPLEDVRPETGFFQQLVLDVLANRYNFRVRPVGMQRPLTMALPGATGTTGSTASTPISIAPGSGAISVSPALGLTFAPGAGIQPIVSLRNGTFAVDDRTIAISQLDLSIDSDPGTIVVQTGATELGDAVVDDILQTLESEFGFRNLRQASTREYLSNVVVTFDRAIEERIKELGIIQTIINDALGAHPVGRLGFERMTFGADLTVVPVTRAHAVQGFVLERRANHPFPENRYFSSAPLKTADHFDTLERIGALIEGKLGP